MLVRLEQHGPLHTLCHCGQSLPQIFTLIFNLVLVVVFELRAMPAPPPPALFYYYFLTKFSNTHEFHRLQILVLVTSGWLLPTSSALPLPPFKNSGVIVSMPRWMLFWSEHWSCGCLELSCLWDQLSLLP